MKAALIIVLAAHLAHAFPILSATRPRTDRPISETNKPWPTIAELVEKKCANHQEPDVCPGFAKDCVFISNITRYDAHVNDACLKKQVDDYQREQKDKDLCQRFNVRGDNLPPCLMRINECKWEAFRNPGKDKTDFVETCVKVKLIPDPELTGIITYASDDANKFDNEDWIKDVKDSATRSDQLRMGGAC